MQFTLTYVGRLRSSAKPKEKHALRQHFHGQLKTLWSISPLSGMANWVAVPPEPNEFSVVRSVHGFSFAPLISEKVKAVAELEITLLWPQTPGNIITSGGDIDNRLKTLFDALKVPSEPSALPAGTSQQAGEEPFFCLLEDDSLIARVSVETDRLLEPCDDTSMVRLFIRVRTRNIGDQWKQLP